MAAISKKHHQFFEGACEEKGQGAKQIDHECGETGNHPMLTHTRARLSNEARSGNTHQGIHKPDGSDGLCAHGVCLNPRGFKFQTIRCQTKPI